MTRQDGRAYDELRPIKITTDFVKFPEGSCLIECGDTKVLCCASIEDKTPPHVAEGEGWVTAEYSMLPRANRERSKRDIAKLKLSPRSAEIQRLVGRSLRAAVDMQALGERTINIDCDVLQGDGGTRTASVTGGFVALALACRKLVEEGCLGSTPIRHFVTGVSAGIVDEQALLDLQYSEDSRAQVDLNCVMNELGEIIELQGTGEGRAYPDGAAGTGAAVRQGQPGTAENSEGSAWRSTVMKFVLATHNPNKIREMGAILGQFDVEVVSPKELGITVDVEETGSTFAENAMLKAKAICELAKLPAIADDSGLCVDALNGGPGVYSARYGGEGLDDKGRYTLLLQNLRGQTTRAAHFTCAIACAFPNGDTITAEGQAPGTIAFAPMGEGGFGYDPVFFVPDKAKTFAQLTQEEKAEISHRGKALREFTAKLETYLKK